MQCTTHNFFSRLQLTIKDIHILKEKNKSNYTFSNRIEMKVDFEKNCDQCTNLVFRRKKFIMVFIIIVSIGNDIELY